jgi:hypothetical protein
MVTGRAGGFAAPGAALVEAAMLSPLLVNLLVNLPGLPAGPPAGQKKTLPPGLDGWRARGKIPAG